MIAYKNAIRLSEFPDVLDIRSEGRRSSVGKIRRGGLLFGKVKHNDRGYNRPTSAKATTRRYLKRASRMILDRFDCIANG